MMIMRILRYLLTESSVTAILFFLTSLMYFASLIYIARTFGIAIRVSFERRFHDHELLGIDPNNNSIHRLNHAALLTNRNGLPRLVRHILHEEISYQRSEEQMMESTANEQPRIIIDCSPIEENRDVNYVCKVSPEEIDEPPKGPNPVAD